MHTITVSDNNFAALQQMAQASGQTLDETITEMIAVQQADAEDERNMDEAIRSPEVRNLLTQLHDAL